MRYKSRLIIFSICIISGLSTLLQSSTNAQTGIAGLRLALNGENQAHELGNVISIDLTVQNDSKETVEKYKTSFENGRVKLLISDDGATYREYIGPGWGTAGNSIGGKITLGPGQSYTATTSVLYNQGVPTDHLSAMYADKIRNERLETGFAMTNAGRYWIKAVLDDGESVVESEPVAIDMSEPIGLDGLIWDRIKNGGAYAYLLQTGSSKYDEGSVEARTFAKGLRQILEDFPDSEFGGRLGEKLIQHERNTENLQQFLSSNQ